MKGQSTARKVIGTKAGKWAIVLSLLGCFVPAFAQQAPPLAPVASRAPTPRIVAEVNGNPITEAQLLDEMEVLYPSNTAHGGINPQRLKEIRAKALDELIAQEMAYEQAVQAKALVPPAEVRAEYQRLRKKYGVEIFDRSLKASGLTPAQYQAQLRRRMTLSKILKQRVLDPARMSDADLRAYYDQNQKKFRRPERVRFRLILAGLPASVTPEDERKAKEKVETLARELKAGKDFAAQAQANSDDFFRVKGGDVGWMHKGTVDPEFDALAFSLPVGEVSKPFRTSYGWQLLKVEEREPSQLMKFESVRDKLRQDLEMKRIEERRAAWIAEMKKGARIRILDVEPAGQPLAAH